MQDRIPLALLEPPADYQDDCSAWPGLPDTIPDWVLEDGPLPEPPPCDCGCTAQHVAPEDPPAAEEPFWAIPGVTGLGDRMTPAGPAVLPPVSELVAQLQSALAVLAHVDPAGVDGVQALADGQALLELEQQLHRVNLRRIGDVGARGLHELLGFRSTKTWLRTHRPDGNHADAALACQLRDYPLLGEAVLSGAVPQVSGRKVLPVLRKVGPHLDRPDQLLDGQPAELVLEGVVRHVMTLICRFLLGLTDDDPRLPLLLARGHSVLASGSQAQVVEAALTWLAEALPPAQLAGPLDEILVTLLPTVLEERAEKGHRRRGLTLTRYEDGRGWHLCGDLDLECGEKAWVALRAEAARDPRNPTDTAAWAAQQAAQHAAQQAADERAAAWVDDITGTTAPGTTAPGATAPGTDATASEASDSAASTPLNGNGSGAEEWRLGAELAGAEHPRNRRERLHDALDRLLTRYLETGLGGTTGKVAVQIAVTISDQSINNCPGAPPPRGDSGQLIPRALVRRWWCDSKVTAFVLTLGGKALRAVHAQRTLSGDERTAQRIEGGDRCAGDGCCSGQPDPLTPLRPHHVLGYAEDQITSLDQTIPVCEVLHRDLHEGKRTVRLRDGRYLNEKGFLDHPDLTDHPPF